MRTTLVSVSFLLLSLMVAACGPRQLPDEGSDAYRQAVAAFYRGVAAVQAGEEVGARASFERVTEIAPAEPAAWANLGLLALRRNEFDEAERRMRRARDLAPDNDQIEMLLGLLEAGQGRFDAAASHFQTAYSWNPSNLKAAYALAQELERQADPTLEERAFTLVDELGERDPNNLALQIETARLALKLGKLDVVQNVARGLSEASDKWPDDARDQLTALRGDLDAEDQRSAATSLAFLRNLLLRLPSYRMDLAEIQTPVEEPGDFVTHFIRLPRPLARPNTADTLLAFERESVAIEHREPVLARFFFSSSTTAPTSVVASGNSVTFGFGETVVVPGTLSRSPHALAALDFDYDFQSDLVAVGEYGVLVFRGDSTEGFIDVTDRTGQPSTVLSRPYRSVWPYDADLDGDLDLLLAPADGAPITLRNNADGTFSAIQPLQGVLGVRAFAYADLDEDGDPDAAVIDAEGKLSLFLNDRGGLFRRTQPPVNGRVEALTVADINSDGRFDLLIVREDGALVQVRDSVEVLIAEPVTGGNAGEARIFAADLDNNGSLDVVVVRGGRSSIRLSSQPGRLDALEIEIDGSVQDVADEDGDGRLDLLVLDQNGVALYRNRGLAPYKSQVIRPRASQAQGDQRINSFGVGGQIDIRSGLLYQKQAILGPQVHFGLGEHAGTDIARIVWPNGDVQAEFDLLADQSLPTQQRLKGSCPWLFTFDGEKMTFVTDFIWRSPLGLAINAQEAAGVLLTEDWVKIKGDQLVARNGKYDVRVTAELWETHFFDYISLLVVDHPRGTEIFVDERFAIPPPDLAPRLTSGVKPVSRVVDHRGRDVTGTVREQDGRYLGGFEKARYQGVAEDHFIEIHLGEELPTDRPIVLVANGWVRPTDSSINVALSQGSTPGPKDLSMEALNEEGEWETVRSGLGFPAGKTKTILLSLDEVLQAYPSLTIRLRTNLEVYWDAIGWAEVYSDAELRTHEAAMVSANLRYRGYSEINQADDVSPEIPVYGSIQGTMRRWFDLEGHYTRFGDVLPLLNELDDRYVIMNAGDELVFHFAAPPDPAPGYVRDFVLIGDGWVKDGDFNTVHSRTVAPLPRHDDTAYDVPLRDITEDEAFRRHPEDWHTYHTRYITPERFTQALAPIP